VWRRRTIATAAVGGGLSIAALFGLSQGGGTIDVFVGSTPTPSGATANLWVDGAGSCTRQPTAGLYVDAQACSDAATAYAAASAGDLVYVKTKSGGYSQIAINNTKAGAAVTIRKAPGETVEVAGIAIGTGVAGAESAGALVLDGFQSTAAKGVSVISADNVTMRNITLSGTAASDGAAEKGLYISNTSTLEFDNLSIGPWGPEDAIQLSATYGNNAGLTFDGLLEFQDSRATATVPSDFHNDCMDAIEINGLTINNARYWACGSQGFYIQGGGPDGPEGPALAQNVTITNSVFGATDPTDPIGSGNDWKVTDPTPGPVTIKNSTFLDFPIINGTTNHQVTIEGSIFAGWNNNSFQCSTLVSNVSVAFKWNDVDSTGCGADATNVVDTSVASKITGTSGTTSAQNAHLTQHITVAGWTQANGCVPLDFDGGSRPTGSSTCDPGADQFGAP
jgi:hypothetical protein